MLAVSKCSEVVRMFQFEFGAKFISLNITGNMKARLVKLGSDRVHRSVQ